MSELTKTREVDEFGNVSYVIREGEQAVGRVLKTGSSAYRVEASSGVWAPVGSIKRGMEWLVQYGYAGVKPVAFEVTCTKPGERVMVIAGGFPGRYDATQFAVKFAGTRAAQGKVVTVRLSDEQSA